MKPHGRNGAFLVFSKELREMLRDKRVRMGVFVTPILIVFMMVMLFGFIASSVGQKAKQKVVLVESDSTVAAALSKSDRLEVTRVPTVAAADDLIKGGKAKLAVVTEPPNAFGQTPVDLHFDSKEDMAEVAKQAVRQVLAPLIQSQESVVLKSHNLSEKQLEPIAFKDVPITVGEGKGASGFIVGFLPYLIVLFAFSGGFTIASDLVAGEKEKQTLETLLITPVGRTQIVVGKMLALGCVCLASSLSSIIGLIICTKLSLPGADTIFSGDLGITPKAVLIVVISIVPLVAFFAGLLVAVSSYARNTREAQTYLGLVYMLVLMPAIFSQSLGFTDLGSKAWINFVPVLNTASNIRAAFQGKSNWTAIGEAILVGVVLAAAMVGIAVRLFNRESVVARI